MAASQAAPDPRLLGRLYSGWSYGSSSDPRSVNVSLQHMADVDCRAAAKRHTAAVLWEQYELMMDEAKQLEGRVGQRYRCSQLQKQAAKAREEALAADQVPGGRLGGRSRRTRRASWPRR